MIHLINFCWGGVQISFLLKNLQLKFNLNFSKLFTLRFFIAINSFEIWWYCRSWLLLHGFYTINFGVSCSKFGLHQILNRLDWNSRILHTIGTLFFKWRCYIHHFNKLFFWFNIDICLFFNKFSKKLELYLVPKLWRWNRLCLFLHLICNFIF